MRTYGRQYMGPVTQNNITFADTDGSTGPFYLTDKNGNTLPANYIYSVSAIYRTDWQGRQLLYDTPRTNLISQSQTIVGGYWNWQNVSYINNFGIAPDGTNAAISIIPSTSTALHNIYPYPTPLSSSEIGVEYCVSGYFKADGNNYALIGADYNGECTTDTYDLITGQSVKAGARDSYFTYISESIENIGNGWWRISLTFSVNTSGIAVSLVYWTFPTVESYGTAYAGDGISGMLFWGAQLETSSAPTSYIPTTSAPVTVTDYTLSGNEVNLGQTPSTTATLQWSGQYLSPVDYVTDITRWVEVSTDANGYNDGVYVTTLAQTLKLNLGESPFFANYGIPQYQTIMTQVFPDYYVMQTQTQFAPYFGSLSVTRKTGVTDPEYRITIQTNYGSIIDATIPT